MHVPVSVHVPVMSYPLWEDSVELPVLPNILASEGPLTINIAAATAAEDISYYNKSISAIVQVQD